MILTRSRARLVETAIIGTLMLLAAASPGLAQASRMGGNIEVIPPSSSSRFPAVAYDEVSDSYLVVTGIAKVSARFVSATGTALGPADSINFTAPGAVGAACSVAANACLVAWVQEPASIIGRLVRNVGGNITPVGNPFAISSGGAAVLTSANPAVAASASGEFLVAWTILSPGAHLMAQRVSAAGAPTGPQFAAANTPGAQEMNPSMTYNTVKDEYTVGYYYEVGPSNNLRLQRVKPGTGALVGGPTTLYSSGFAQYPEIAYNTRENQYLGITWGFAPGVLWMLHGGLADGNGQPLTGALPMAPQGGGDGIGLAYNPISNTYLAVFMSLRNDEVWAVEIDKNGLPGTQFQLTAWGALNPQISTQPSVGGSTRDPRWLGVTSAGYARIAGNMAQTATVDGPAQTRIISVTGSMAFGSVQTGKTGTRPLTISNTGTGPLTVSGLTYPAGFSGSWSGTIAAGNAQSVSVTFSPTAVTSYGGTITVNANQTSGTSTTAASGTGRRAVAVADFDGDAAADIGVYRPTTGMWYVRNQFAIAFGEPGDVPVAGDYNGDGVSDVAVYNPSTSTWHVQGKFDLVFGIPGDVPVPGDYNGDGTTDVAVYRPSTGEWLVNGQPTVQFGLTGDLPVPGDYDGDSITDIAVYRPSAGMWLIRNITTAVWGAPGDLPVPADFNGDGRIDIAVFRPSTGFWFIKDFGQYDDTWGAAGDVPFPLDRDGDGVAELGVFRRATGTWFFKNHVNNTSETVIWGAAGDIPLGRIPLGLTVRAGDFDGDLKADLTVFRPSTGDWLSLRSVSNRTDSTQRNWGVAGDIPVGRDYDGDGRIDPAVFRPTTGDWYVRRSTSNFTTGDTRTWGLVGDIPVPADYDGDGKADYAVFRPSLGRWVILLSSTGNTSYVQYDWGLDGDVPVPADYDGDGRSDPAVFRPSTGRWYILNRFTGAFIMMDWGLAGDVPVAGDFDGDRKADVAVFRPSLGRWFIKSSIDGTYQVVDWGLAGDVLVPADYNGDGITDVAVFRPATNTWWVRGLFHHDWGIAGDIPALKVP